MKHILVVDDSRTSMSKTVNALKDTYLLATAASGKEALHFLRKRKVDLILLDYVMPGLDGMEVLKLLKADPVLKTIPVIFLTSNLEIEIEAGCLDNGAADFIGKPFATKTLMSRVARTLELEGYRQDMEKEVRRKTEEIESIQRNVVINLANVIECRDSDSGHHVKRTGAYVGLIAKGLQEAGEYKNILTDKFIEKLVQAAALHDIGKIMIPDSILNKPGKLTPEEFEIIKEHTLIGSELAREILTGVESVDYMELAEQIAHYHHEKWDGTGYPGRLRGEEIPLCARIMAIADVFDALISKRCYKEAYTLDEAFAIIKDSKGKHFDPLAADIFLKSRDQIEVIIHKFVDYGSIAEAVG